MFGGNTRRMPVQPHLFPTAPEAPPEAPPPPPVGSAPPATAAPGPVWLQRTSLFILVLFCIYLGGFVTVLPWWKDVWDNNNFFQAHPQLWAVLRLGPVRGIISGLGLLDIWIGISEAVHYREASRS
jgi:hypothetical protein